MSILSHELSSLLGGSGDSWRWQDHIHPASFRGVPFAVVTGDGTFGRRQAVHEYPYRDTAWIEDMGRATRRLTLRGFIIQSSLVYSAGDVMTQRDSLVAACESTGPGTLIHPTLGELTVSIPSGGLKINEGPAGRVFEFTLTVIESGLRVFALTDAASAASTVSSSWLSLASKAAATFISEVRGDLRTVTQAIKTLKSTGTFWTDLVKGSADEATNLSNTLKSTFGSTRYGRYNDGIVGGSVSGTNDGINTASDTDDYIALVAQKIAVSVENGAGIDEAISAMRASNDIVSYSENVLAVVSAINKGVASLRNLIRVWETLVRYNDNTYRQADGDSAVAAAAQYYFIVLSAGAMANAAAQYTPSSYDDAMGIMSRVIIVIDTVTLKIADAGYDDVYREMQVLRDNVVSSLQSAGADLATIETVVISRPLPALTLAQKFYQDATRTESLVKMADPIHPAFMPISFKALTS